MVNLLKISVKLSLTQFLTFSYHSMESRFTGVIRGFYNLQVVSYHLQVDMLLASFYYHQQQISYIDLYPHPMLPDKDH